MKRLLCVTLFLFIGILPSFAASEADLVNAEELASYGVIVKRYNQDAYRLDDPILRQEVVGISIKVANIQLPEFYKCAGYFADATFGTADERAWVCRAVEIAADHGLISRLLEKDAKDRLTRPAQHITHAEALAIMMGAGKYDLSQQILDPAPHPEIADLIFEEQYALWQVSLYRRAIIEGIIEPSYTTVAVGHEIYPPGTKLVNFPANGSATRAQVFAFAKQIIDIHPLPKKCLSLGSFAGYSESIDPSDENALQCCEGLTRAPHKSSQLIPTLGYVCIKTGDKFCDSNHESFYNSPTDCRQRFNDTGCTFWYVGCNWCSRSPSNTLSCTQRSCLGVASEDPYCASCKDGYTLINGHCVLDRPDYDLSVCTAYHDGCNDCSIEDGQLAACTEKACRIHTRPYCSHFINQVTDEIFDAETLDAIDQNILEYTKDKTCVLDTDCKVQEYGYKGCSYATKYLIYSTRKVNEEALQMQIGAHDDFAKTMVAAYGLLSDCRKIDIPVQAVCQASVCQLPVVEE